MPPKNKGGPVQFGSIKVPSSKPKKSKKLDADAAAKKEDNGKKLIVSSSKPVKNAIDQPRNSS